MHRSRALPDPFPRRTVKAGHGFPKTAPRLRRSRYPLARTLSGSPGFSTGKCLKLMHPFTLGHLKYKILWLSLDTFY
jgi:hypothetical protein